jgi:hypothetical protein
MGKGVEFLCGAAPPVLSLTGRRNPHISMVSQSAKEIFILGINHQGKAFRPSDWAERLAGVMSQFRPGGPQPGSHLGYSPWCVPTSFGQTKCVIVHRDLRDYDVMAWDFCMNFARDNELQVSENRPVVPDNNGQ